MSTQTLHTPGGQRVSSKEHGRTGEPGLLIRRDLIAAEGAMASAALQGAARHSVCAGHELPARSPRMRTARPPLSRLIAGKCARYRRRNVTTGIPLLAKQFMVLVHLEARRCKKSRPYVLVALTPGKHLDATCMFIEQFVY